MFLKDSAASAQSKNCRGIGRPGRFISAISGELHDRRSGLSLGVDRENLPAFIAHEVKAIPDQLKAYLQKLVGIAHDFWQCRIEFDAHFNVKSLPLRLSELHRSAGQRIEIQG